MTTTEHRDRIAIADPTLSTRAKEAVEAVLDSGSLAGGDELAAFESEFAAYCNADHGVGTTNGTTALHAALEALEIGDGDRVITTPFTFIATGNAIRFTGAEPVFADIDPTTYNLDPDAVESTIQDHNGEIDGILAVHLFGLPAEMDRLGEIAKTYDIPLIEDAAQAHGARYRGEPVGAIGDVGCFSFYPTKNMTTGEGGMVITDRDDVAVRARQFIDHGRAEGYSHERLGHNFRMTDVAAAIGRVQLDRLPHYLAERRKNAQRLRERIADTSVDLPVEPDHATHAYNQFTIRSDRRDELKAHLDEFGIDSSIYYPIPVHEQDAYDCVTASAPVAERTCKKVLSVPIHPMLSKSSVDTVAEGIRYFESFV